MLDARAHFSGSTLADLYDPLTMPPTLLKAHQALDRVVDLAYRKQTFASERERVEFLFERYEALLAPLVTMPKKRGAKGVRMSLAVKLSSWIPAFAGMTGSFCLNAMRLCLRRW